MDSMYAQGLITDEVGVSVYWEDQLVYLCTGKAWYLCTGKTRLLSIVEVPRAHPPPLMGEHIPALKKFFGILLVCQLVPRFFHKLLYTWSSVIKFSPKVTI